MFPLEMLERRLLLSANPTVYEQYMLSLVNRARLNPAAEAQRYGIALNEGVPASATISSAAKQPLAFNPSLNYAADLHTQWMLAADVFSHTGEYGTNPQERDETAGYLFEAPYAWGENLAYTGQVGQLPEAIPTIERLHQNLFVDIGIDGRGHRTSMLRDYFGETGVGISDGLFNDGTNEAMVWMLTQEFANSAGDPLITGVAFADTMLRDGAYTPFEGLGAVTIEARAVSGSTIYRATTWDAGGYSLQVPAGQYIVRAYGGDLPSVMEYGLVSIGDENVPVDFNATNTANVPVLIESGVVRLIGTTGNDVIRAVNLGDRIRLSMNSANYDFPKSAVTAIEIHAAAGDDYIDIDANLTVTGISGDEGNDTILGGSLTDYLGGGTGNDVINGRFGDDSITGGDGHDFLEGRAGRDSIFGGKGRDTIYGGNHDDMLWGANAADYVNGEDGNDTISGGPNHDTLIGGGGDDRFVAADGQRDYMDGGDGFDTANIDPLLDVLDRVEL